MKNSVQLKITGLPKISLNQWYAGRHWSERKKIKDDYIKIVKSQVKQRFAGKCYCDYKFFFWSQPLDASNCVAMVKMIEDILLENDGYKNVKGISITSDKIKRSKTDKSVQSDYVLINIMEE